MTKYEVGDVVRCLKDHVPILGGRRCFHKGGEYVVGGHWHSPVVDNVGIVADDRGEANGWHSDYFERAFGPW